MAIGADKGLAEKRTGRMIGDGSPHMGMGQKSQLRKSLMKAPLAYRNNHGASLVEPLESRIAPAAVTLTFTDVAGATVKVTA